jgi:glucose-6-phosphate 1-dehydrogenase
LREKRDLNLNSEKDIFCEFGAPESNALIIFGATGDLSRKKLIPTLLSLFRKRRLPSQFFLLGCAVNPYNDDTFREEVKKAVKNHFPDLSLKEIHPFLQNCCYLSLDFREGQAYELLAKRLKELEEKYKTQGNRLFYSPLFPVYILLS